MGTRLHSVVIDSTDHEAQGRWWAHTLGWTVVSCDEREAEIAPGTAAGPDLTLAFIPVPDAKRGKNRVHVDLACATERSRRQLIEWVLTHGARPVDIGQADVPWTVLADPEGNELCVLAADARAREPDVLAAVVVDVVRPMPLASFWAQASGWQISCNSHLVAKLRHPGRRRPTMDLVAVPDPTPGRNRVHLDVAPPPTGDHRAEIERLIHAGARLADVGQGDEPWAVLTDPDGNEFCVLSAR